MADDYSKMIAPRADEELHDGKESDFRHAIDPKDNLPVQVTQALVDSPPGLSVDNLICMADTSSFVRRNAWGEVEQTFAPSDVSRFPNGDYFTKHPSLSGGLVVRVEPVRPQCAHYLRQMTDIGTDRERRFIARACMMQRSETGEYVSLRDSAVYACSIREPRHLPSEELLDSFDESKISEELDKKSREVFDVDAELAKENLGVLGKS